MRNCKWQIKVAALQDGEFKAEEASIRAHMQDCTACSAYAREVESLHGLAARYSDVPQAIQDPQFGAFMAGIHEGIQPKPRHRGIWAKISLTTAALLMALATFYLITLGPDAVKATEVERISTDLEGVTVEWSDAQDGTATVWVNMSGDDLW